MKIQSYDGNTDDLLTAGLGKTGLASATAPTIANLSTDSGVAGVYFRDGTLFAAEANSHEKVVPLTQPAASR